MNTDGAPIRDETMDAIDELLQYFDPSLEATAGSTLEDARSAPKEIALFLVKEPTRVSRNVHISFSTIVCSFGRPMGVA